MPLVQIVEELEDLVLALAVEVAGRLIGQEQSGFIGQARAIATRCRSPTERLMGRWFRRWPRPTCTISRSARSVRSSSAPGGLEHGNLHVLHRGQGG